MHDVFRLALTLLVAAAPFRVCAPALAGDDMTAVEAALARFAQDYRTDPEALVPVSFAVSVGEETFAIATRRSGASVEVTIERGAPETPTFGFRTDPATLMKIDAGELNGLTALAQTRAGDPAPMTLDLTPGFEPDDPASFRAVFLSVAFHFWTRGKPETVALDYEASRIAHGANAVAIYYDNDVHTAWYTVRKGQHVNKDPKDQTNDHPSLFIVTGGRGMARIDGVEREIAANEAIRIPAGAPHEFWNPNEEPLEFVLLMWGFPHTDR